MNKFETLLEVSYVELEERSNPMTVSQSQKVKKMKSSGWDIEKRDEDKVVMKKDGKEMFVYPTGKTFFISEGVEYDVTDLTDIDFDLDNQDD